jgi:hypothetical protein
VTGRLIALGKAIRRFFLSNQTLTFRQRRSPDAPQCAAALAVNDTARGPPLRSEILRPKARPFPDFRHHSGADLFRVMERERIFRPAFLLQDLMGTDRAVQTPTTPE